MKKIFTLLFFAGFLTTGFAQSRRDQNGHQNDGNRNQPSEYPQSYPGNNSNDRNYQPQGRDNDRDQGYNGDRDGGYNRGRDNDRDHNYNGDRDNNRERGRGRDKWNHNDNWDRDNERGHDNYDGCDNARNVQYTPRTRGSLLQIILSGTIRL
jgi:hypothetical protein